MKLLFPMASIASTAVALLMRIGEVQNRSIGRWQGKWFSCTPHYCGSPAVVVISWAVLIGWHSWYSQSKEAPKAVLHWPAVEWVTHCHITMMRGTLTPWLQSFNMAGYLAYYCYQSSTASIHSHMECTTHHLCSGLHHAASPCDLPHPFNTEQSVQSNTTHFKYYRAK